MNSGARASFRFVDACARTARLATAGDFDDRGATTAGNSSNTTFQLPAGPLPVTALRKPRGASPSRVSPKSNFRSAARAVEQSSNQAKRANIGGERSTISKGYGVERVADELDARGVADYMVEIGVEGCARGKNIH